MKMQRQRPAQVSPRKAGAAENASWRKIARFNRPPKEEKKTKTRRWDFLIGELYSLRKLIDERDMVGSDINERLCGVEKQILELVAGQT